MDENIKRYYQKTYAGHYDKLDPLPSKDQLLSLAALIIDLGPEHQEWLQEVEERLGELEQ